MTGNFNRFLKQVNLKNLNLSLTTEQIKFFRKEFNRLTIQTDKKGPEMKRVQQIKFKTQQHRIPARLYTPVMIEKDQKSAGIVFFHGGGYIVGNLDTHDGLCRRLAHFSKVRVLSIEYRLAPEHKFPAAIEDAETVLSFLFKTGEEAFLIDQKRILLAGDSAGGGIAAVMAQTFRRKIKYQILIYPLLQLQDLKGSKQSIIRFLGGNMILTRVRDLYLNTKAQAHDLRVSPLFQMDLTGLAPAYIITCGRDPLKTEGSVYTKHLESAGIPVVYKEYKHALHGFCSNTRLFSEGITAVREVSKCILI